MAKGETIIISLGGSIVVPDDIDVEYLLRFRDCLTSQIGNFKKCLIVVGGGRTARRYVGALSQVMTPTETDKDWLGIQGASLNGLLVKTIFKPWPQIEVANPTVLDKKMDLAWRGVDPGHSSDYTTVVLAKKYRAKKIINLTNTDYVFDKDPNKFADAKKIENISWKDFRKLVGSKWIPGGHFPFDPIASREAEKLKLEVYLMNGRNLSALNKFLSSGKFEGTRIT